MKGGRVLLVAWMVTLLNLFSTQINHCHAHDTPNDAGDAPKPTGDAPAGDAAAGAAPAAGDAAAGAAPVPTGGKVCLNLTDKTVVTMDNGIVQVTLRIPEGDIVGIKYNGVENVLEAKNKESGRGYWDLVWQSDGLPACKKSCVSMLLATEFKIIANTPTYAELSFSHKWDPNSWKQSNPENPLPLNYERRFAMFPGQCGYYQYLILEREPTFPPFTIWQYRAVFKLQRDRFHYMAVSDERQRLMPAMDDRTNGQPLDYPEAVLLTNPVDPTMKGQVDDKYMYSKEDSENKVHGWVSFKPSIGFWMISASDEWRTGGPYKQELTSHVGPTITAACHTAHYAGNDMHMIFKEGEAWKKVMGPYFVFMNTAGGDSTDTKVVWEGAKKQMEEEVKKWPYDFPQSPDFPKAKERGGVCGRLQVNDSFVDKKLIPAKSAWVGLAPPGEVGSWQNETKCYQFWVKTDDTGAFQINGVREGTYNLFATVPGFIGEYKYETEIKITPGCNQKLGDLVFSPLRNGPTLWEIGIPDRYSAEFFIPDPPKDRVNPLYLKFDRFRQYGLWERYAEMFPKCDLVYDVAKSDYKKDWWYGQFNRKSGKGYVGTTWQVLFDLPQVDPKKCYTLRIALAEANGAEIQVRFNDPKKERPHFTTHLFGRDNAVARHGMHGLYWLFNVEVQGSWLVQGKNILYLNQPRIASQFSAVMYDYLRLEGPL